MRANRVPAAGGARWLLEGLRALRAAPLQLMLLHLAFMLVVVFMLSLPSIGFALFWLFTPALLVGPHAAVRAAARGGRPDLALMFEGFRTNLPAMLQLGALMLGVLFAALGATALADDGRLFRAMVGIERLRIEDLLDPGLHRALLLWGLLETSILSLLWYAPLLVAWHGVPALKSAFFSAAATVLNWRAMLAFGAVLVAGLLALSFFALAVAGLLARSEGARISAAAFAATWTFLPILFAASWRSYEAIFAGTPAAGGGSSSGDTGAEAD
jgi:hypothetical protein